MKIKLDCTMLGEPSGAPGDVVDVSEAQAKALIKRGWAEKSSSGRGGGQADDRPQPGPGRSGRQPAD